MTTVDHVFGGAHTEPKLQCLREYLAAFSIALKKQNFARLYVDAFAGTGSRAEVRPAIPILGSLEPEVVTTQGSADIALNTQPQFHHISLIEQDPSKIGALKDVITRSGHKGAHVRQGDANQIVKAICRNTPWRGRGTIGNGIRGVIFLDPYGMEVEWSTVEAIAQTEALDCWYFFPLSGLYRNAPRDPLKLDPVKVSSLNRVLGTQDWRDALYDKPPPVETMFGMFDGEERRIEVDAIEAYVQTRLASVFKGTVLKPMRINNALGKPLASLFFAVSNRSPAAVGLATSIASHILKAGISSQVR
ncbi:three-Cys-motif partner protein TcmP [Rhizobium deserti]|uniref:Three-Cys-motif partner protein TcmP n=1 Tax=Rhizobium deserti TaxID=2547961 RepID=A0A4R5UMW1_9HYPH|nr:three-Cys-motif partner protein TcmP [Rhizobium deserti]TDK39216.1 three-Cys-motif partner protein TcmP [Rhizobium deserti]